MTPKKDLHKNSHLFLIVMQVFEKKKLSLPQKSNNSAVTLKLRSFSPTIFYPPSENSSFSNMFYLASKPISNTVAARV